MLDDLVPMEGLGPARPRSANAVLYQLSYIGAARIAAPPFAAAHRRDGNRPGRSTPVNRPAPLAHCHDAAAQRAR